MTRPLAEIAAEIAEVERAWSALSVRSGQGNPYHDPATGQFTGPGGSTGKHPRRRRKLRRLLRRHRRRFRALKSRQQAERHALVARQRERRQKHREHYDRRMSNLKSRQGKELASMDARHARDYERFEREVAKDHEANDRRLARGDISPETHAKKKAGLDEALPGRRESDAAERATRENHHEGERNNLRDERRHYARELQDSQRKHRRAMGRRHAEERAQFREDARDDLAAHGFRHKGASRGLPGAGGGDADRLLPRGVDDAGLRVGRAFKPGRTHKAGSAEAILKHCLRSLGLSAAYRRGELTGLQALELLAAVREYARGWLRHEAEQLIRHYGRAVDGGSERSAGSARHDQGHRDPAGPGGRDGVGRILGGDRGVGEGGRVDSGAGEARSLSSAMRRHVGRFFDRARNFIRESILAGAMALSGPEGLDEEDLREADRQQEAQVAYLDNFRRDVETRTPPELAEPSGAALENPMTAAQFAARAELYGNTPWTGAMSITRKAIIRGGRFTQEIRIHSRPPGHHECQTCIDASLAGWQPVGTLPEIGDSECQGSCDCYFLFREGPDGKPVHIGEYRHRAPRRVA